MLGFAAAAGVAACAFLVAVLAGHGLVQASLWAAVLGGVAGVVAAVAAVWALVPRSSKELLPPETKVPEWVIGRPRELTAVVAALVGGRTGTVGITTGLYGAGGFGKTVLAQMVCADRRVRRRFNGRVYLVTVGRDVHGAAAVAAKVNDVIKLIGNEAATFADPELAGRRLGSLLDTGPRRLLVLDDVWEAEQLAPFVEGGRRCVRLVTTRMPGLLEGQGEAVRVDQMSPEQAREVLTYRLPAIDPTVTEGLLSVTGGWPLLLRLINKVLADYAHMAPDLSAQGAALLERLHAGGPAAVDDLLRGVGRGLDVGLPQERARAVRMTIGASTELLDLQEAERFAELGVFVEDEVIPFGMLAQFWRATSGLPDLEAAQVVKRLIQLALASEVVGGITLHDVIRDFLRAELGERVTRLNQVLVDAIEAGLPAANPLGPEIPQTAQVAWWELGDDDRYTWRHLIEHLRDAGRHGEADAAAGDLRWVGARLVRYGPAAPIADLSLAGTPRTTRLSAVLARAAHLLAPTEPPEAVVDVLYSRVAVDPEWGEQVTALRNLHDRPYLANRWQLPDLPISALRRVLAGHTGPVSAVAVAPDGSWLASASWDKTVRVWDAASGRERAVLHGHTGPVNAVAVAPDGSWLASASWDKTVRVWDAATGRERAVLHGHTGPVNAVAVAPDGSWLASGGAQTVRVWDAVTGRQRAVLHGHTGPVNAVAVAPDGSWLASGGAQTVRIWDAVTGRQRAVLQGHAMTVNALAVAPDGSWLTSGSSDQRACIWRLVSGGWEAAILEGHTGAVNALTVAPDGSWLASVSDDQTVRIWDAATRREQVVLQGHTMPVGGLAVAPDGSWIVSGSSDQTVRIWDTGSGPERAFLPDHAKGVRAVAVAPDGSWVASGGWDKTVRIWNAATGGEQAVLQGHVGRVDAVAVAPDGSWLASGSSDQTVRIWDTGSGQERALLRGHTGPVRAVAVTLDGSWVASGGWDKTVRIWNAATGGEQAVLQGHVGRVDAVAVAPDGSWLASGGWDNTVRIWDISTGRTRAVLQGHTRPVNTVAVAPDGSWLASGSDDQTVRIWDVSTGRTRAVLQGHTRPVNTVAVAPDGSWLASGSSDQALRIWDASTSRTHAMIRLDSDITACSWMGTKSLAVGGSAGPCLFDLHLAYRHQRSPASAPAKPTGPVGT